MKIQNKLKKIMLIGSFIVSLTSCMDSENVIKKQGTLNLTSLPELITDKCLLKGGVKGLNATIPTFVAKGTNSQIEMKLFCNNGTIFDVTKDTNFNVNNTSILEVSKTGIIKAKTQGNTEIIYSYNASDKIMHKISVTNPLVTDISISGTDTYIAGEEATLHVHAIFSDGSTTDNLDSSVVEWKSSDDNIATIKKGILNLHRKGVATIYATYEGKEANLVVDVSDAKIKSITILPKNLVIDALISDDIQIHAEANLGNGDKIALDDDSLTCTSSDTSLLKFSDKKNCLLELANVKKTGSAEITVSYKDFETKQNIAVTSDKITELKLEVNTNSLLPNTSREFKIIAITDKESYNVTNNLELISSDENIISTKRGVNSIYAYKADKVKLSTSFGEGKDTRYHSQEVVVDDIAIEIAETLPLGSSSNVDARTIDEKGVAHYVFAAITSNNPSIASVKCSGSGDLIWGCTVTANKKGTAIIRATLPKDGGYADKKITIDDAKVKSIEIKGLSNSIKLGYTQELELYANYTDGNNMKVADATSIQWKSMPADIISISPNGVITPKKIGVATIIANYNGYQATASINVDDAEVIGMKVEPTELNLTGLIFDSDILNAKLIFSDKSEETIDSDKLICVSSDDKLVSVRNFRGCQVIANSTLGHATISVSYDKYTQKVPVSVTSDKIKEIQLNADTNNLLVGDIRQYELVAVSTSGKKLSVSSSFIINSSNPDVVSFEYGTLKAKKVGQSTITVVYDGKTYVNKVITIGAEKIISADIKLKNGSDYVNMQSLMPHKSYSVEINCETNKGRRLIGDECGLALVLKSGNAIVNNNQVTGLLAGNLVIHDNSFNQDFHLNIAPIANPEYEKAGGYGSLFNKIIMSDSGSGTFLDIYTENDGQSKIERDLAEQGRYGIISNYVQNSGGGAHWIDINLNLHTNRPIKPYFMIRYNTSDYHDCKPRNGVWFNGSQFGAVPYGSSNFNEQRGEIDCSGKGFGSKPLNNNAVRLN